MKEITIDTKNIDLEGLTAEEIIEYGENLVDNMEQLGYTLNLK